MQANDAALDGPPKIFNPSPSPHESSVRPAGKQASKERENEEGKKWENKNGSLLYGGAFRVSHVHLPKNTLLSLTSLPLFLETGLCGLRESLVPALGQSGVEG